MRPFSHSLPLVLLPLVLPAMAGGTTTPGIPASAGDCGKRADETMGATSRVDSALSELGAEMPPVSAPVDSPMPDAPEGQAVIVSDSGLFFDSANSQLVYLHNVRLNDARVKLRAANRLYIQLPQQEDGKKQEAASKPAPPAQPKSAPQPPEKPATPAPGQKPATPPPPATPAPEPTTPAPAVVPVSPATPPAPQEQPAPAPEAEEAPSPPVQVVAYDALVDSVANRMLFTSGPGVPELSFRQGENQIVLTQEGDTPARALADEAGNILLEAPVIHLVWQAEDGSRTELTSTGGRALYHAATHALVMEGPVEANHRDGESTLQCSGPFCVTLKPDAKAKPRKESGFMSQFTSMRFNGVAAATATGNVQLHSRTGGEGLAISGDALHYNGQTGRIEVPGTPCLLSCGNDGQNTLQTNGCLVLEPSGDILFKGDGNIEGTYERPAPGGDGAPVRGTLTAKAPLIFHANHGTVTTSALNARDAEASLSCTGEVLLTLTPCSAGELAAAQLPSREEAGMVNLAIARYNGISAVKAVGQVRGRMLDSTAPAAQESTLSASQLDADLLTGEMRLTGAGESAAISFHGYALSGTADAHSSASVHLKPNGDIEARGARVSCSIPGDKGITTLTCADRMLLAREPRSLSLGSGTRIQSPDGIVTTTGAMQAVLAPGTKPARPLSPRYPHLTYDFSGLESAETFEGATVRTPKGSLQCTQHLSILMLPADQAARSTMGGIRSAIATGQVLIAAKDANNRVMRAAGDRMVIDGITGEKRLTGSKVVLEDARNRHVASGAGAAVRIDARNNARITGARHSTFATGIRGQVEEKKAQDQKNKTN